MFKKITLIEVGLIVVLLASVFAAAYCFSNIRKTLTSGASAPVVEKQSTENSTRVNGTIKVYVGK